MTDPAFRSIFKNDSVMGRHLDGDGDGDEDSTDSSSMTLTATSPHSGTGSYNTGPKGVQRDARAFKESESARLSHLRAQSTRGTQSVTAMTWDQETRDADARDRWVERRLKDLSKRRAMERVTIETYLSLIESQRAVCVVIHDEEEEECVEFLEAMGTLTKKYVALKMVSLSYREAELDRVACPAVLLYEDGDLKVNAMRVVDEIPSGEEISGRSVEEVLVKVGILKDGFRLDKE